MCEVASRPKAPTTTAPTKRNNDNGSNSKDTFINRTNEVHASRSTPTDTYEESSQNTQTRRIYETRRKSTTHITSALDRALSSEAITKIVANLRIGNDVTVSWTFQSDGREEHMSEGTIVGKENNHVKIHYKDLGLQTLPPSDADVLITGIHPKIAKRSISDLPPFTFATRAVQTTPDVVVYSDGGCQQQTGVGAAAICALDINNTLEHAIYQSATTNNVCEYGAVIAALRLANRLTDKTVLVIMDSEIVLKQILGQAKCECAHLSPLRTTSSNNTGTHDASQHQLS